MPKPLIIVESRTKGELIQRFLGADYVVAPCVGHIRDLPEKASEIPEADRKAGYGEMAINISDDFRPYYILSPEKREQVAKLRQLMKGATSLYLATDEDREGESISWHLREVLKPKVPVHRMVFHEITPEAIRHALANPRQIDERLVSAQETRRVVDRLFGYAVSPVLWRKLNRVAPSAGRVQTPAVRLLVEREKARMVFRSATWWDLEGQFASGGGDVPASLASVGGRRVARTPDFDESTGALKDAKCLLLDERAARALAARLAGRPGRVSRVDARPWAKSPEPPFTTSTLQQEANRKFRWSASHTMKIAQRLYEAGWITYMRTDSVALSTQAVRAARALIASQYGAAYLPEEPRRFKNSAKNAQEAHEAVRPAGEQFNSIAHAHSALGPDDARLYELVWKRAVASQMVNARGRQVTVDLDVDDTRFVATGRTVEFAGYQRAYVEGSDDPEAELAERDRVLPDLSVGDAVTVRALEARGHVTQPPARLTEATLVKELEKRGIGRPSTYADIIEKILRRGYAFKKGNALIPSWTAFLLVNFLERQLAELADYDFTARIEDDLDRIALGKGSRSRTLSEFYLGDAGLQGRLQRALEAEDDGIFRLALSGPPSGDTHVRVGRYGPYVADGERRINVPADLPPDELTASWVQAQANVRPEGPRTVGSAPDGTPILLFHGRFGPYLQKGEANGTARPPRASVPPGTDPEALTPEQAWALLSLPRELGTDPATSRPVVATIGRFGPYVKRGEESRTIPAELSVFTISLAQALELLAASPRRARAQAEELASFGPDPASGGVIRLLKGRYGPYVTDGETNATVPKGTDPAALTAESAQSLLAARREAGPRVARGRFGRGKAGTRKTRATTGEVRAAGAGPKATRPAKASATPAKPASAGKVKAAAKARTATKARKQPAAKQAAPTKRRAGTAPPDDASEAS
jgi:DNA topoisomerase-1